MIDRKEMERRRIAACKDLLRGKKQAWVAQRYRVSRTTVSRWNVAVWVSGEPLLSTRATGRPAKVSMPDLLKVFRSKAKWSAGELRDALEARLGVSYHKDHIYRLIPRLRAEAR